jgi:hypothetical protein
MPIDVGGNIINSDGFNVNSFSKSIVTDGLICYLDAANKNSYSGTGNTWYDLSGNGNHGTLINSPTYSSINGGNFYFNGSNQQIDTPFTGSPSCYAFEIAIKQWQAVTGNPETNMAPNYSCVGMTVNGNNLAGLNIGSWTGGATYETISWWNFGGGNSGMTYIRDDVSYAYHIYTINWNGSKYDIWLDGVKRTNYDWSNGQSNLMTNVTKMNIGLLGQGTWDYYFKGDIGFVRAYNRTLHSAEIINNYYSNKSRFGL